MKTLYAIHRDGARLYLPRWDADGEIIASKLPTAAVTITLEGVTFPDGSTWIRKPRGCGLLDGWKLVSGEKATHDKPRKKRAPNASLLLRYATSAQSAPQSKGLTDTYSGEIGWIANSGL